VIAADKSPDVPDEAVRRRAALLTLTNLGSHIKEFEKLTYREISEVTSLRTEQVISRLALARRLSQSVFGPESG